MNSTRTLSLLVTTLLLSPIIFLTGCGKEKEAASAAPPEVEVATVEQRDVPIYSESVGTLQADVNATISAQVTGYLLSRNYEEGRLVTNGQVLFKIDDRSYKAALEQAQAKLAKTELDVQRYTPLAKTQAISQQELDDAVQANIANQAAVDAAKLDVDFCTITAPVDGAAGLAQAQVGDLVSPAFGALTTVTKVNPIRVYFSISQQLLTRLLEERLKEGEGRLNDTNGPPLELILATGTTYPLKGRVRFSDNQVDVKTGTIRVVGEFENPDGLLIPGMFVRVRAEIGVDKNALLVPQRAVAELQGRKLIAVVDGDNKISIRPIETGETSGPLWVIAGGIKPGDRVVAEGIQKLRQGITVNPVPYGSESSPAPEP